MPSLELPPEFSRLSVLVLDDEEYVVDELTFALRRSGLNIHTYTDPAAAIEAMRDHPNICVVVTDIRMPEIDGFEALRRMGLPRCGESAAEVVLMTGHGTPADVDQARRIGAYGVLHKPFMLDEALIMVVAAATRAVHNRRSEH